MVTISDSQSTQAFPDSQFIGNHPAFDLINTVSDRRAIDQACDRLRKPDDLIPWSLRAGVIKSDMPAVGLDEDVLRSVKQLREAAHDALEARIAGRAPSAAALHTICHYLQASDGIKLSRPGDLTSAIVVAGQWDSLLGALSLQVLDAIFRLPQNRIGACPACGWLFLDVTRGGRRRWCSMATCGNRTKVKRHRGRSVPFV